MEEIWRDIIISRSLSCVHCKTNLDSSSFIIFFLVYGCLGIWVLVRVMLEGEGEVLMQSVVQSYDSRERSKVEASR